MSTIWDETNDSWLPPGVVKRYWIPGEVTKAMHDVLEAEDGSAYIIKANEMKPLPETWGRRFDCVDDALAAVEMMMHMGV
jgi:hypothetical protein